MGTITEWAEAFSLLLTWPTVILAMLVVFLGKSSAYASLKSGKTRTSEEWLILGVVISFIGQIGDNLYWGVAWSLSFVDWTESKTFFFRYGVWSNIPFRQAVGMLAAFCHLKAFSLRLPKWEELVVRIWWISMILGCLYIALLMIVQCLS